MKIIWKYILLFLMVSGTFTFVYQFEAPFTQSLLCGVAVGLSACGICYAETKKRWIYYMMITLTLLIAVGCSVYLTKDMKEINTYLLVLLGMFIARLPKKKPTYPIPPLDKM